MKRILDYLASLLFPERLSPEAQAYRDAHEDQWEAAWGEWSGQQRGPDGVFED